MRALQALREQDVQKPAGFRVQDAFSQIGKISFWLEVCMCVLGWGGGMGLDQQAWEPKEGFNL